MKDNSSEPLDISFYDALVKRLGTGAVTIDLYSVSACFGFYSNGMRVFSEVLRALREAATTPGAFQLNALRILIKADNHLIDTFGVERLHFFLDKGPVTILEMAEPKNKKDWIQFAIFDNDEVIYTEPQKGFTDDALALQINKVSTARSIAKSKNQELVDHYIQLFGQAWDRGARFEIPRLPSLEELSLRLKEGFHVVPGLKQKEYQEQIRIFLGALVGKVGLVRAGYTVGDNVIDLLIGVPKQRAIAVEVKLASNAEEDIKAWKGRVEGNRGEAVNEVLLVIVGAGIKPEKLRDLKSHFERDAGVKVLQLR